MSDIHIEHHPDAARLESLGMSSWGIWTKEVSTFPWTYDERETCCLPEGEVEVTPDGGVPVRIGKGDRVTFPAGMSCIWEIRAAVRKHYRFWLTGSSRKLFEALDRVLFGFALNP